MSQRKFFALVFALMLLFAGFVSAGCGGSGGMPINSDVPDTPGNPDNPDALYLKK